MSHNSNAKINYIPREIEKEIGRYLKLPQIIALVGPRRAGKTTLLLHLKSKLKNSLYLTFEDKDVLDLFEKDIKNFARLYLEKNKYLFLDEFHYARQGGKNLKYLYDAYPDKKIFISGSSAADLTVKAIKFLTGRLIVLILYPFSFGEFLTAQDTQLKNIWEKTPIDQLAGSPIGQKIASRFEEYLTFGGYPEVVQQKNREVKITLLKNIYHLLFLREVKDFLNLADDYKVRQLALALALQVGNLINYQELGQTISLDFKTLKSYLSFLEKVYVCRTLPPFFTNKRKEIVKSPKIYFLDNGLLNAVTNNFSPLKERPNAGAILENIAFQILKENQIKYWRSKTKTEVDFILEKESRTLPVEIKLGAKTSQIPLSLRSFIDYYNPLKAIVGTWSYCGENKLGQTVIKFLPVWAMEKKLLL